jgi:uncharacterized glyoxalase superfamily protein PhnB
MTELVGSATVFVVEDVLRSVAFYRDRLGFDVAFTYGEPVFYGGVCRGDVTIHLQAARASKHQRGQGAINIFTADVDAVYEEFRQRGVAATNAPADRPYGMRDFDLTDPDGNFLCFGTGLGEGNSGE